MNKKYRKILILGTVIFVFVTGFFVARVVQAKESNVNNQTYIDFDKNSAKLKSNFFVSRVSSKELYDSSDLIVKGRFMGVKEFGPQTASVEGADGEMHDLTLEVVKYDFEINDDIKNPNKRRVIEVTFISDSDLLPDIGPEYVLFLSEHIDKENISHSLICYEQGYYLYDKSNNKVKPVKYGNEIDYKSFKEKYKSMQESKKD